MRMGIFSCRHRFDHSTIGLPINRKSINRVKELFGFLFLLPIASICLMLLVACISCNGGDISTSDPGNLALSFVKAVQEENFQIIWNSYLPYQQKVADIHNSNAKQFWESIEQEKLEKEKAEQYPNGEWGSWSSYLKNATFEVLEVRPVENEPAAALVFIQVAYLDRAHSPLDNDTLLEKLVLRLKTLRNGSAISSMDQSPSSAIPWPDDESTKIEIANRYYKAGNRTKALEILQAPVTPEGKELRARILYDQYAQKALSITIDYQGVNRAMKAMNEAVQLNPALKDQFHSLGLSIFNQHDTSDKWWIKEDAYPLLERLVYFFPEDNFIRGKIVQYALISAENCVCWGHHPNVTEIHGGRRDIPHAIDVANKYGGNSALTQSIINQLLSTYNDAQNRDEYVKQCDETYRRGPMYLELEQKSPEEFVSTNKTDNPSIEEKTHTPGSAYITNNNGVEIHDSCLRESTTISTSGVDETSFTISNLRSELLIVYWVDYNGQRQKWFELQPGEKYHRQDTFKTHPWLVADSSGNCIQIFNAPADIVIQPIEGR